MVAVAHLPPARHARLVVVRSAPAQQVQPVRLPAATYRRRRAAAAGIVTTVVVALFVALQGLLGTFGGGPHTVPEPSRVPGPVHVVQPGDTFWDIARVLRPHGDPRPLVTRLVAAHGSSVLLVGERIPLPTGG